ncbi:type I polyketide synthase [Acidithiobacillus sp. M4-SHS-6]|uniref:type I polyketide synthase n=1 Tax=Acidithiobacillus sp. M4-SHS-6 TaxID=3383024 RepID=UPI0039BDD5A7
MKKIAIIGQASRLPQCPGDSFWSQLLAGRDLITHVAGERWAQDVLQHPERHHPGTSVTFAAGSLGDVAGFDAGFFHLSPREAAAMDPQQRLLLEMSWEAFAHAGIAPGRLRGSRCGVFIGLASTDYAYRLADDFAAIGPSTATGSTASIAANRLSYFYDLQGPSLVVDTACSSALVAFHQACQSIASGESDLALTGAISLHLHPYGFLIFSKASMLSPKGRCRPFDADADGYVRSEGGGVFVLKSLDQAVKAGDRILAVVAHSAINTDGHKSGLTIPRVSAQQRLLEQSYEAAGIDPEQLDYLEAHGTGTAVGDPAEVEAIGRALGVHRRAEEPLPIGSVKSNIGHLETASGVPGLLKTIHVLQNRLVPPTIGINTLNPRLQLETHHLTVVRQTLALRATGLLIAGVNSFGFGGANAHIILESAPTPRRRRVPAWRGKRAAAKPLCLSAATPSALRQVVADFARNLETENAQNTYPALYQANFRRERLPHRALFWLQPGPDMLSPLRAFGTEQGAAVPTAVALDNPQGPVFVYSGNGSQWSGMGRILCADPVFAASLAEIDQHFQPLAGYSLQADLAGHLGEDRYAATEQAQPALFALQVGITALLRAQGIVPAAVAGHSVGEVAAAWACGALTLAQAVRVIYERSRLQGYSRGLGQMTAVAAAADTLVQQLQDWDLQDAVTIAAWNSPRGATLVGSSAALDRVEKQLRAQGTGYKRLDMDYPFHSPQMDLLRDELLTVLQDLRPASTSIPFISAVTGTVLDGDNLDGDYWWQNIRQPVRFQQAAATLLEDWNIFVELGGHPVLRGYLQEAIDANGKEGRVIPTLRRQEENARAVFQAAESLWLVGITPDWKRYFPVIPQHLDLPHYPWEREAYWHDQTSESARLLQQYAIHPLLGHPLAGHPGEWEQRLDTALLPFLADHQVGEGVVFPGAGYVELGLAAARAYFGASAAHPVWVLEELDILLPLLLEGQDSKMLRVHYDAQGNFRISSRNLLQEAWTLHAKGRVRAGSSAAPESRFPLAYGGSEADASVPDFSREIHYQRCRAAGLHYGPVFQTVVQGWLAPGSITAQLELGIPDTEDYVLHPALLDGAMQLFVDFLAKGEPMQGQGHSGWAYVPVRFGALTVYRSVPGKIQVLVQVLRHSPQSLLARLWFADESGQLLAQCDELRLRRMRLHKAESEKLHYVRTVLRPVPRSEKRAHILELDLAALADALAVWSVAHGAGQRYVAEYSPLAHSLLQTYDEESAGQGNAEIAAADIWQMLLQDYPEFFPLTLAIGRYGLGEVGEKTPTRLATSLYPPLMATLSPGVIQVLQKQIAHWLDTLSAAQTLDIMEMGSTVAEALPIWAEQYGADPRISLWQGCWSDGAEIQEATAWQVVSIGAAHTTPAVHLLWLRLDGETLARQWEMLRTAQQSLLPGGILLIQGVEPESWWAQIDAETAGLPGRQALKPWLEEQSFEDLGPILEEQPAGSYCLCLRKKSVESDQQASHSLSNSPATGTWYLCGSSAALAEAECLKAALTTRGQSCRELSLPTAGTDPAEHLPVASQMPIAGIILLPEVASPIAGRGDAISAAGRAEILLDGCTRLWQLGLWCIHQQDVPPLFLFGMANDLEYAGLSGFARSLQNEWPELQLRILTLGHQAAESGVSLMADMPAAVSAAVEEILDPGPESEWVFDLAGGRFTPQVQEGAAPRPDYPAGADQGSIRRLEFSAPGQLRHLHWIHAPEQIPEDHDVEVEVENAGLNFRDVMYALGLLADEALENGFSGPSLGLEFAGRVRRVGAAVTRWQAGDAVMGFAPASFSSRILTPENAVTAIPEGLSMAAAATIPTVFLTAWYSLHTLAQLQAGENILIHGAAGGVGIAAIQIARHLGAEIYATAGSPQKRDFLRLLGVRHIYDSRQLDFAEEILRDTEGAGVDVLLNSLYGEAVLRNLQILRPFGRFLELGKRDFYENNAIGLRPFRNNLSYFGIDADQLLKGRPALTQQLFAEIMALFQDGTFYSLPATTFPAARVMEAFRHMQQARQIGKVVLDMAAPYLPSAPVPENPPRLQLSAEGVYLVTGGLTGFGFASACRLAERGARNLVLVSRSGQADAASAEIIARLQGQGVHIHAWSCDVRDAWQVQDLVQRVTREVGPLRGIIHAAAVIEDGLAQNLSREQMDRVIQPKVAGAWNLHQAVQGMTLDFFVLYSSITTLLGNPGQAHYVAANTWLEAFTQWRRRQGLPALAILWGAIGDAGYLTRHEKTRDLLQQRLGGAALSAATALDVLERLLRSDADGWVVADLDWHALQRFLPIAAAPRFSAVMPAATGDNERSEDDLRQQLQSLPPAEAEQLLVESIRREVAQILRLPLDKVLPDQSLSQLGLDSLMGVELALALEERIGLKLPAFLLSEGPTPLRLARRLLQSLGKEGAEAEGQEGDAAARAQLEAQHGVA